GVLIPVDQLPAWGTIVALFSPPTYFTDMVRHLLLGKGFYPLTLDFIVIIVFATIFMSITVKLHEKNLQND
ncbi:MAG: ABC transporter permease, partial [Nitrososphaerales archaeon]